MKRNRHFQAGESTGARLPAQTTNSNETSNQVHASRDEVARNAYLIYVDQGYPEGRELQHWLEAEAQTMATAASGTSDS